MYGYRISQSKAQRKYVLVYQVQVHAQAIEMSNKDKANQDAG